MSFNDAESRVSDSEDINPAQSTKRDASSLFVDDADFDDDLDSPGSRSIKRTKIGSSIDIDSLLAGLKVGPDGEVIGYDAEAEDRPRLAIYHPSFKAAERTISDICSDLMTTVEQVKADYDCEFPEIDHICEHNLKPFLTPQAEYPLVGPIALLGSAGIGKSSFTGCILDSRGAAPESDGTKRGTSVVHEYCAAPANQKSLFQVGAIYFTKSQVETLVKTHCDKIFTYLDESEELEEDDLNELQRQYENATEFFQILLCDQDGFESKEAAEGYFDDRKGDDIDDVVEDLTDLIEAFKSTRNLQDNVEYRSAETHGELAEIFKLVSRAPAATRSQKPHPWPLIVKVQILQDKDILNAGVVLADCPGITDTNRGVVDSTMNYLKQAGTILIFEKIERITENPALEANIRACLRLGKRSNIHLVVTKIDLKQRVKPEDRGDLLLRDRRMLEEAEGVVEELKRRKAMLTQNKANASGEEREAILTELHEAMPKKLALAESRIDQVNIEIRNKDVAERLKGKIRQLERSDNAPDLKVHFISSTQYQQHLQGYELEKPPLLDIDGTGIPGVRNMLLEIPARGKSNTLQRMCCTALPVNLHAIVGILTKSPMARKEEVAKLIEKVLRGYTALLAGLEEDLRALFDHHVCTTIAANESKWCDKASSLINKWETIHASTFMAFCRKSGHWRKKKGERMESWNYNIQNIFEDRLILAFNSLDTDIARTSANTATNIKDLFSTLERELKECEDFQGNSEAAGFFEVIRLTRDDLNKQMEKLFSEFDDNTVSVIRNNAILEDKDEKESSLLSFVSQAMENTYESCVTMSFNERRNKKKPGSGRKTSKKSGIHPKCVDAIRQRLMGTGQEKSVFAAVSDATKDAFEEGLKLWKKMFEDALAKGCKIIRDDFNERFVADDVKTEEDDEAAKVLKETALEALSRAVELKQKVQEFVEHEKVGQALR